MTWTFCPKCGARVDWAATCSECGAGIPVHEAASSLGKGLPSPLYAEAPPEKETDYGLEPETVNRLLVLVLCLGLVVALVLLVQYTTASHLTADAQPPATAAATDNTVLEADRIPPRITALGVSSGSGARATVTWVTDEASSSQVEYFHGTSVRAISGDVASLTTTHAVTLEALEPGATYHFVARSTDASGNLASSGESVLNTPLSGAGGRTEASFVYFHESQVLGSDKAPIELYNNRDAVDVTWDYLQQFLLEDQTDRMPYVNGSFDCSEFAETLHNNAERAGIRAAYVCLNFEEARSGHAINAFRTTDAGLVYIDDTGQPVAYTCSLDTRVAVELGRTYCPELVFPCPYIMGLVPLGTVSDISLTW